MTALPPEPGHEPDLSCGLEENPCPEPAEVDDSPDDDYDVADVNDYDAYPDDEEE